MRRRKRNITIGILVIVLGVAGGLMYVGGSGTTRSISTEPVDITTATGLQIQDKVVGNGTIAQAGDVVSVHYTGTLDDGTTFDSSYDRTEPLTFTLGIGQVIPGWDQGIDGMRVGGQRRLVIPPDLAYGESGKGQIIPPNATLHFDVELIDVRRAQ